jgi:predicted CoA-binding protein
MFFLNLIGKKMREENFIFDFLKNYREIVVVGLSRNHLKDSFIVARYMKRNGYQIIPINPFAEKILGEKSYSNLLELPEEMQQKIEIINLFRPSDEVLPFVKQAVKLKRKLGRPYVIWMQLGIINNKAAETARRAGLYVIMDKCIMTEHIKHRRKLELK